MKQHVKHLHTYSCTISCKLVVVFLESSSDDLPLLPQPAFPHHSVPGLVRRVGNCCEASQSRNHPVLKGKSGTTLLLAFMFLEGKKECKRLLGYQSILRKKKTENSSSIALSNSFSKSSWQVAWHQTCGIWPVAPSGQERNQEKKGGSKGPGNLQFYQNKYLACIYWIYLTPPTSNIQQLGSPILSLSQKHAFHSARASSSSVSLPGTSRRERTLNSLATWYLLNPGWDPWDMAAPRIASSLGSLPCPIHDPRRSPGRPCIKKTSRNWVEAPSGSCLSGFRCIKLCFCLSSLQLLLETAPKVGEKSQVAASQRMMLFLAIFPQVQLASAMACCCVLKTYSEDLDLPAS